MIKIRKISVTPTIVYDINVEDNHNFFANGILVHNCQESFSNFRPSEIDTYLDSETDIIHKEYTSGLVHTCNLVSINLAETKDDELDYICTLAVNILDRTIDHTGSPIKESEMHNKRYRTIGVGAMGLADYLAVNNHMYERSVGIVDDLFERIAMYCITASISLAQNCGKYKAYDGSEWSKGIVFGKDRDWFRENSKYKDQWNEILDDMSKHGIRNSQILAIAPNTSSSLLQGCTAGILPPFSKFSYDKSGNGNVPVCPPFIKDKFWYYKEGKNIPQTTIIDMVSAIQKWVDQGISMEMVYNMNNDITAKDIWDTIFYAWEQNVKTIYYTRTIQMSGALSSKEECVSCAN